MKNKIPKIAFFGTPERATIVLDELKKVGILPVLIVTQPDRPQGRKLVLTPPPAKLWAEKEKISFIQPENLDDISFKETLTKGNFDMFVVVAYGKILKKEILAIPKKGAINLHASLLPKLRGSCPIETAILNDEKETGVTIILMDELMDHGPILAQEIVPTSKWPLPADELAHALVTSGGKLMAKTITDLDQGKITPKEQNHAEATYTKKIVKEDGLINLSDDPYKNFLKWNAYKGWPGSFFFIEQDGKQVRITITDAVFEDGKFVIKKVIPEGKKEISWQS
jgi:methionyl-tRNA formyltransferase